MPKLRHLVVSISGHGFGHVAQTAPILNTLHQLLPQLRITVRSAVANGHLRSRIQAPFEHLPSEGDLGMVMCSALDVSVAESLAVYNEFHADWDRRVEREASLLRKLKADFVLSNVGYLPLAGAQQARIANAALCSLNWEDIYRYYCDLARLAHDPTNTYKTSDGAPEERIAAQIHSCYAEADVFFRATPGMAMNSLPNLRVVAPIAAVGNNRRDELNDWLKLDREQKLVLISMGGIASRLPIESWPRIDGVRWLVQESWHTQHPDAIVLESVPMNFNDLLASSDALLCKPGYGSFVESSCMGVPVLYVNRPDWPEAPALVEWLHTHNRCREIPRLELEQGNFAEDLEYILNAANSVPVKPEGAAQVAAWLMQQLGYIL